jgi:hypothetical protein
LKWFLRRSVCRYFPQDLLVNCDKYDELKIVVSIGNANITSSWNMIQQRTLLLPSYWVFEKII